MEGVPTETPRSFTAIVEEIERIQRSQVLDEGGPSLLQQILSLQHPPRGAAVEARKMEEYVARAKANRQPLTNEQLSSYDRAMQHLFGVRKLPAYERENVLTSVGRLDRGVFHRALKRVSADSSPGYPLTNTNAQNRDVDPELLYALVDHHIRALVGADDDTWNRDPLWLLENGLVFPATVFVKGEVTKISKVARLIFGSSLIASVAHRVIFGDFLEGVVDTWTSESHKVGMDMYSEEGKLRFYASYQSAQASALKHGFALMASTDVQGWDYATRVEFARSWYVHYERSLPQTTAHAWQRHLTRMSGKSELASMFSVRSDGVLVYSLEFFRLSGLWRTHIGNSDERAALAIAIGELYRYPNTILVLTNGDDCIEPIRPEDIDTLAQRYLAWGLVLTDILPMKGDDPVVFSSSVFKRDRLSGAVTRIPTNIAKILSNLLSDSATVEAIADMSVNLLEHPGYSLFREVLRFRAV